MKPAIPPKTFAEPETWHQLPWGDYYRETLQTCLRPWFARIFGFHLLKIGNLSADMDTRDCAIAHQVSVTAQTRGGQVIATPSQLPFAAKSVDACFLLHSLCWCSDPHRLLREVDRVLVDDGWLVISGFNPLSLAGAGKIVPFLRQRPPYNSRMFSLTRQADWLALLNFQVLHRGCCHVLPWRVQGGKFPGTHLPALGCLQIIVARKRTFPLTLLPLTWRRRKAQLRPVVGATRLRK